MHVFPKMTPLAALLVKQCLRRQHLPASLLLSASLSLPTLAQAQQVSFDIPAQPLGAALQRFGLQADMQLLYSPDLARGLRSQAVQGSLEPAQALARLLAGSGLSFSIDGNTITLLPASTSDSAVQLGATNVTSNSLGAISEGTHAYTTGSTSTATKLPMSIRETPQSVTVVTRQRIEDENLVNLDDVLTNATGVTLVKNGTERTNYYARGQQIDTLQIDGVPTNIANAYSLDAISKPNTDLYDRVEIVRGANGLMQGAGNPSAAINLIRKRPTVEPQVQVTSSVGSWDTYRNSVDVSSALNDAGTLRGRSVVSYTTGHSYRDHAKKENSLIYGILEADLDDSSMVTLGFSYQKDRNPGYDWSGLPAKANGEFYPLSRSTALTADWAHLNKSNTNVFVDYQKHFDNDWKLVLAANQIWAKSDFLANYTWPVANNPGRYTLNPRGFRYDDTQTSLDGYLSGPFQLLGRQHDLIVGFNARQDDFDYHGGRDASYNYGFDVNDLGAFNPPAPNINYNLWKYNYTTEQQGAYLATRLSLTDSTKLILGSRLSWYKTETDLLGVKADYSKNREVTPYAGIVQELNDNFSAYASYTEVFKPQSNVDYNGSVLAPATGSNYELGLKGETLDKRFGGSLALFQTDLTGTAEQLDSCAPGVPSCFAAKEKIRTTGLDLEAYGELTPNWNLSAGYTYASPRYEGGASKGSAANTDIPRHLFKLTTDYRLPAPLEKLRVGGSVLSQTHMYKETATYRVEQAGYTVTNLHAVYEIDKHFELQGNLNNAFDKKYYQTVQFNHYNNFFGDPRNFTVTLRAKF
ncbi:TonB-dependent siderophore receptor [Pantoea sp. Cy-639]|uniref:TonB-dependent siderophore receptor n=1 Tax=Pantoea sp. Cy-639 TaxID=2608360 RepID=UPI00196534A2|nr:TonB-dependent siderophore receptor [Pantoea sp. Cy-639]